MLNDFIDKLRRKPRREREKMAVIATAVSFLLILIIWLVSFSEMDRGAKKETETKSLSDQIDEMKNSVKDDRESIQDMIQSLPQGGMESSETSGAGNLKNEMPANFDEGNTRQENPTLP